MIIKNDCFIIFDSCVALRIARYICIYKNRYIERLIDSHIRKVKRDRNKKKRNNVYTIISANGGKLQTIDGWYHRLFRINPFRYSDCFWINW